MADPRMSQAHPEMTALLKTFPFMRSKLAYWPYDVVEDSVVQRAYSCASSGEKAVIEFLLSVWNPNVDWTEHGYRNFNLARAVGILSNAEPIAAWIKRPFWP